MDVLIDRACEAALPACLALLGPVAKPDVVVFQARNSKGELIGAAGLLWQSWGRPPGFPAWVCVLPAYRALGVGGSLVKTLIAQAQGETGILWAASPLVEGAPAAKFAAKCNFLQSHRQLFFRADLAFFLSVMSKTVQHLINRGRVPTDFSIVPLRESPRRLVVDLVTRELRDAAPGLASVIINADVAGPGSIIDPLRSLVVMRHGEVAGALLVRLHVDSKAVQIVANVVKKSYRRSWVNAVLLEATSRYSLTEGSTYFDFDCGDDIKDTIGLARRGKADLLRSECLFSYAVASATL